MNPDLYDSSSYFSKQNYINSNALIVHKEQLNLAMQMAFPIVAHTI